MDININQVIIVIFGAAAIFLVGRKEKWSRWGYIMGMLSQPFWLIESFKNEQWGFFILSIWYTYSWGQGIWNYWIKPDDKK